MSFVVRKAERQGARLLIQLSGVSGSGKTYTALQLAYGLANQDASETAFAKSVYNYEYHMQAAWYLDGVRQCLGKDAPQAFIFAAFEKDAPHAVAFYSADGEMVSMGRREYKRRLQIYAECKSKDHWPGYPAGITTLSLPAWAVKAANDNAPGVAA